MSTEKTMHKNISLLKAWAFSIGTSVGWGSLVVTSSTYLKQAGPMGTVLGLVTGAFVMFIISHNYAYMMKSYPEAGGAYTYAKELFGYDQGFLIAWFVAVTYFAMLWANATSLPLFGRIFLGGVFRVGRMYSLFGYDVYFGETLLSISAIIFFGLLCAKKKNLAADLMAGLATLFSAGIIICFAAAFFGVRFPMTPAFLPDASALSQVVKIAVISPWAFIGFESISHQAEEFSFSHEKIEGLLFFSVISTVVLYVLVTLLSVTAYPAQFSNWIEYIGALDSLEGLEALPAFYAASVYLGNAGVLLLMLALIALVVTSLIGNITALSRLFYALAKDRVLPADFSVLSDRGIPEKAVLLVTGISCVVPFIGRTAIGWIVDVTTIGAVLIYGFVSACTAAMARKMEDRTEFLTGRLGLGVMIALGVYFLAPNFVTIGSLSAETYFLFIVWSVLGFLFFRTILQRDKRKRFGSSVSVWIALLTLVLTIALIWMRQSMLANFGSKIAAVNSFFENGGNTADQVFMIGILEEMERSNMRTIIMAIVMFGFCLVIMMTNHSYLNRRTKESEMVAKRDPMTGVGSKHAYMIKENELNSLIHEGEAEPFAIVVCDVNGLKKINDTLGHKAGDEYIRKACTMICDIFRHSPVFRVGGDEFVAVLSGRDFAHKNELMTALHDRSAEHIQSNDAVVSGGLAVFMPEKDHNVHDVFQRADELMYQEKKVLKSLGAVTRDDESDAAEAAAEAEKAGKLTPSDETILNIRRFVLIADDEETNRIMLGSVLEDQFDILYAADGEETMEIVRARKDDIALVLLDLMMPLLDGREVLKQMSADPELRMIPVIVLTADQEAELECLKLGAMDFIPKPYPIMEVIRARVNRCIELSESRGIIRSTERDSLTQLFNIDYFYRYVKMFDHHYWDMNMDAVLLDVTRFHMINERFGRNYGDTILSRIGERVRHLSREIGGVGCHKGADTFLIYCPHREDYASLLDKASIDLVGEKESADRVRLRIGVYANVDKSLDIERRFDRAKIAADSAKGSFGKAVAVYDDEMGKASMYKERLLEDFRTSIERKDFIVYYQPKYDIRPSSPILSSAEALVRWNHPEFGMISPGVFIPLLEENGLILELDTYVWRTAAAQVREWKDTLGFSVPVSVNVSRIDMLMMNLTNVLRGILEDYGLTEKDIVLELTESAYTSDSEQVLNTARELRGMGMGFRIEMDDFGSGYSSLGMLTRLPIDALKLDMTFIRSAFGEKKDVRMIELIIDIADYLKVPVVAEGVETEEQYLVLKSLGCDMIQGYYFSRPVPEEQFREFLFRRKGQSVEQIPAIRKTYMSVSTALNSDYESMFYVDTVTDYYLEFCSGPEGELKIFPGGDDFYHDAEEKILASIVKEDQETVRESLRKVNLVKKAGKEDTEKILFRKTADGGQVQYSLSTIRTRGSDDHHVVIGIRREG